MENNNYYDENEDRELDNETENESGNCGSGIAGTVVKLIIGGIGGAIAYHFVRKKIAKKGNSIFKKKEDDSEDVVYTVDGEEVEIVEE